jgi:glycosyltransferase involved in cell wall biosynthesis
MRDDAVVPARSSLVLMDATPLQSEHRYRGVGTYVRHLSRELARRWPDQVRFVLTAQPRVDLDPRVRARAVVGMRPHRPAQVYWLYNELFLRWAVRACRPALFHATDFNGLPSMPGLPVVVTLYDLTGLSGSLSARIVSDRLSRWRWTVYHRHLAQTTRIIAISAHVKRTAVDVLGLPATRIAVIPLGVDTDHFRPTAPAGRRGPTYFLYVGSLEPHKNVAAALQAFAQLRRAHPGVELWMAGPWSAEGRRQLEQQCRDLHIAASTRLFGHVDLRELVSLYQHALAMVFPSLAEGFGAPIVEAMACGTPVICANFGAMAEVAGAAALTVDVRDVGALAQAMQDLVRHDRLRDTLTQAGLTRARGYSWPTVAERTWAVYTEVLAESGQGTR